jgi:hypothetical protein
MGRTALLIFRGLRASLFLIWMGGAITAISTTWGSAKAQDVAAVIAEHRTTVLEAGYIQLRDEIRELKTLIYWVLFGTLGLTGEAGLRLGSGAIRRRGL